MKLHTDKETKNMIHQRGTERESMKPQREPGENRQPGTQPGTQGEPGNPQKVKDAEMMKKGTWNRQM